MIMRLTGAKMIRSLRVRNHGDYSNTRLFSTISDLQERTRIAMEASLDDSNVVALLQEWLDETDPKAADQMSLILQRWLDHTHRPRTIEPFSLLLAKHKHTQNGNAAALVLDHWGNLLGGDLELSPPLSAFHMVLQAHGTSNSQGSKDILEFLEKAHTNGDYALTPTVETYSYVISAIFANRGKVDSGMMARMQEAFDADKKTPEYCYHMIRAYSKALGTKDDPTKSLAWFEDLEKNLQSTDALKLALLVENPVERVVSLLGTAHKSALSILVETPTMLDHAQQGKRMLDYLESLNLEDLPWIEHFDPVVQLWANKAFLENNADAVIQELLYRLENKHLASSMRPRLPFKAYENILYFWCQTGKAAEAEDLLVHFMRMYDQDQIKNAQPRRVTKMWNNVMQAHFFENKPKRAVALWDRMQELESVRMDQRSYSAVLKSISRLPPSHAVRRASKVWEALQVDPNVSPHASHFASLISTWAASSARGSADYALEILEELEARYKESGREELQPLRVHYSAVVTAFGRSRDPKSVEKALAVFERMKEYYEPDTIAYSALISALANRRSTESAEQAEELLEEMISAPDLPGGQQVNPNVVTYTSVMMGWAKSGRPERAENVLSRMLERYAETGDETIRPDSVIYGAIISAWAKGRSHDIGDRAEAVLRKVQHMEEETGESLLNKVIYTNVIAAHWRSRQESAAAKALDILQEMKERAGNGDLDCMPDTISYTTAIQALARSRASDKSVQAWNLLTEMCNEYRSGNMSMKPNVISFTACMNACAFTGGGPEARNRAVKITLMAMNEFQANNYDSPSHIMYCTALKVFGRQVRDVDKRSQYVSVVFKRCCLDGQVDESTIQLLQQYVPDLYDRLPRNQNREIELPAEWTMNVRAKVW